MLFGSRQYLEYETEEGRRERVPIRSLPFVIGSDDSCNLSIAHADVSPRHAAIRKNGEDWEIEVVGHTPVVVAGVRVERAAAIRSGDDVDIGGVFGFFFRDVDEEAAGKKRQRQVEQPAATAPVAEPANRTRIIALLLFSIVSSLSIAVAGLVREPRDDVDMTSISEDSVKQAVGAIGECIARAAKAGRDAKARRVTEAWARASYGSYWRLVMDASAGPDSARNQDKAASLDVLKGDVEGWLKDGMLYELHNRPADAKIAYEKVLRSVPDSSCPPHQLAASRMSALN